MLLCCSIYLLSILRVKKDSELAQTTVPQEEALHAMINKLDHPKPTEPSNKNWWHQ